MSRFDAAMGPAASPERDRSPLSLTLTLATAAERVRCDPPANLADGAARAAGLVLRGRLDNWLDRSDEAGDDQRGEVTGTERWPAADRRH